MEFSLLGPLDARHDGRQLALGPPKQRAVLAVLLLHANETVPVERLIDLVWGEAPPATVAGMVQVYVSRLRRVIEGAQPSDGRPVRLLRQRPGYRLSIDPDQIDLCRFERLASRGRLALRAGDAGPAASLLGEGLALWRGPALADFDSPALRNGQGARLEELRLSALEDRIDADLACGLDAELVGELTALVAAHPLRERFVGQQMLALYRCGRQAEALALYQRARRRMVGELGIEPCPALQDLQRAILRNDHGLGPARPSRHEPRPDGRAPHVPPAGARDRPRPAPRRRLLSWLAVAAGVVAVMTVASSLHLLTPFATEPAVPPMAVVNATPWWASDGTGLRVDGSRLRVDVPGGTTHPWDRMVGQSGIRLEKGRPYRLSFAISASTRSTVRAQVQLEDPPYSAVLSRYITVDRNEMYYSYAFVSRLTTDRGQVTFQVGGNPQSFTTWIHDVTLVAT